MAQKTQVVRAPGGLFPALVAGCLEFFQVVVPVDFLIFTKVIQRFPGVDAGVMTVIVMRLYGVITDRVDFGDGNILLAGLQHPLPGSVTPYLGGR